MADRYNLNKICLRDELNKDMLLNIGFKFDKINYIYKKIISYTKYKNGYYTESIYVAINKDISQVEVVFLDDTFLITEKNYTKYFYDPDVDIERFTEYYQKGIMKANDVLNHLVKNGIIKFKYF